MYRVWFTQENGSRTFLDDNSKGFSSDDALDVARQLKDMGNRDVLIVWMGSPADREEMKGAIK